MTSPIPTLPGITARTITSSRLATRVLFSGPENGTPILFIHGNVSSATYFEETMLALPARFRGIAPDLRGFGDAELSKKIDATRGFSDLADDMIALLDTLKIEKAHLVAHSMGGSVIWQMLIDYSPRILSVTTIAPTSPYGFGGTKDVAGNPCYADFAGSGAGVVNGDFVKAIVAEDRSTGNNSPRDIMNNYYFNPPFKPVREEDLLSSLLSTHIGAQDYAGDLVPSQNWPNVAPGAWGQVNAMSPKYAGDVTRLYRIPHKPDILWVRGSHDQIVSDTSLFDIGMLGSLGAIPGWPGAEVFPPQPMVSQTRAVLQEYAKSGGKYEELVIQDTGHSPYIEKPDEFNTAFHALLAREAIPQAK